MPMIHCALYKPIINAKEWNSRRGNGMKSGVACRVSETNKMSTSGSCKDGASKLSSDDDVCGLNNMSIDNNTVSVCANCGKEGDDVNNICHKCKMVKYCNAACKKKHRKKHKKQCERRVAELHDVELFKQPPLEDCPICFQPMPSINTGWRYKTCCGKVICCGCSHAPVYDNQGNEVDNKKCAFCRTPYPETGEEVIKREKKRVDLDDPIAIFNLGIYYREGKNGYPQDYTKALELWHRAAELGYAEAYCSIGVAFYKGKGVYRDKKKVWYYWESGAMAGDVQARRNLGILEEVESDYHELAAIRDAGARFSLGCHEASAGNMSRAIKHYMLAVRGGDSVSLENIKKLYSKGNATKEDYTKALQSYQVYLGEIKSDQRDKAAAYDDQFRYY